MPEGPEVRRAADRIARALGDAPLEDVEFTQDHLRDAGAGLIGRRLLAADTRGKAFTLRFEGDLVLYVHLQLYGKWMIRGRGALPRTNRQLRVALHGPEKSALLYSASDIALLTSAALPHHPYIQKLGPDLLADGTTAELVARRADEQAFRGRQLASLLLDQGFLAGVGNYLRTEILYEAGLAPARRPKDLSPEERAAFGEAAVTVGHRALTHPGVTTPWAEVRQLKAAGAPRREYRHMAFGRAGHPCRRCGGTIDKRTAAGRRLYRCPGCQR
jgi:endonuclease-8